MERRRWWRRWLVVVTAGELVGFTLPAIAGVWSRDAAAPVQLVVLPLAGMCEGAVLGLAQAHVLRPVVPGLRTRAWVVATSVAAGVAWLLGLLPSAAYGTWSGWPVVWAVLLGIPLAVGLLASVGAAQVLVTPRPVRRPSSWVGWTALGWLAGLGAFFAVAPPLWREGQPLWLILLIGGIGGAAMAVTMAAVTGVGAVRLMSRAARGDHRRGFGPGSHSVTSWIGTPVHDVTGRRVGRLRDLVVDLAPAGTDHPDRATGSGVASAVTEAAGAPPATRHPRFPVTDVVISARGLPLLAAWRDVRVRPGADGLVLARRPVPFDRAALAPARLLVRRDLLDCPVVTTDPPGRTRVSDVGVVVDGRGAWVTGLDLDPRGLLRRLAPRRDEPLTSAVVPISSVHLASRRGHAAQLLASDGVARHLPAEAVAEVLTRLPVTPARAEVQGVDDAVAEEALRLLHPVVRDRVTGIGRPPRRTRRLAGWRLHRPRQNAEPGRRE